MQYRFVVELPKPDADSPRMFYVQIIHGNVDNPTVREFVIDIRSRITRDRSEWRRRHDPEVEGCLIGLLGRSRMALGSRGTCAQDLFSARLDFTPVEVSSRHEGSSYHLRLRPVALG